MNAMNQLEDAPSASAASEHLDASLLSALDGNFATIAFTPNGVITWANDAFLGALGYTAAEVVGQHHRMFCEAAYVSRPSYQTFWKELAAGTPHHGEFLRLRKDRSPIWIQAAYAPVRGADGAVTGVVKIAQDITATKTQSLDSAGKIAALDRANAVIEFDVDGTILAANDNFLAAVGYQRAEILGRHHSLFVDPVESASPSYRRFWESLGGGRFHGGRYRRIAKGGREIWIQATYNPIFGHNGEVVKVVKFASDVTSEVTRNQRFHAEISAVSAHLDGTGQGLTASSQEMSAQAATTSTEVATVSYAASQVSAGLQTLASATEEMTVSIGEISRNANDAARVASEASALAHGTNATMAELGESSAAIGQVTKVIRSIAEQTNLLALNATIEAARAGEAGRGFAVVAGEVKDLAKQTARATQQIGERIDAIQAITTRSIDAIGRITDIIGTLSDGANSIASAVEQQTAVTDEIARNVSEAATGTQDIERGMELVESASRAVAERSTTVQTAAGELADLSGQLKALLAALDET